MAKNTKCVVEIVQTGFMKKIVLPVEHVKHFCALFAQKRILEKIVIWIQLYRTAQRVLENRMKKMENLAIMMAHVHFIVLV